MKRHFTFAVAEVTALAAYVALSPLLTHFIVSVFRGKWSDHLFKILVIYSELPIAFICGVIAGLIIRRHPVLFGSIWGALVLTIDLTLGSSVDNIHFWIVTLFFFVLAIVGALTGVKVMSIYGKSDPIRPAMATLICISIIVLFNTVSFLIMT